MAETDGVGVPRGVADLFLRPMRTVLGGCRILGLVLSAGSGAQVLLSGLCTRHPVHG